jgi:DNA-binding transcriptional LysR family regulator
VRIEQLEPEEGLPALGRGELDVAMAGEYDLTPGRLHTSAERLNLFTEPVLVAVPAKHPLPGPHVRLSDLRDARWIATVPGSSCAVLLERSRAIAGYEPAAVGHCADFALAAALVAAGHGIALVPSMAAPTADGPAVRLLTVEDVPIHRTLYAAIRFGTRRHPATACLIEVLTVAAG